MATTYNCPNCGAAQDPAFRAARMMTCTSCGTTLFLDPSGARDAGSAGVMHDAPSLLTLGTDVRLAGAVWHVVGHARYSYGRGHWDEYWCTSGDDAAWISVDEGDVVVQRALPPDDAPRLSGPPPTGQTIEVASGFWGADTYRVTEREEARCEAIRGSFPEPLEVGETHTFVNANGEHGGLLSGEFWDGGQAWFLGEWVDPFDVRAA
ncbi:DUF4178 domain-containing protein [Pseudaestuariivita atlantica]|uniref:DUF4178 domain-containing protein n=1 Tax=Pseudaestuariivita atlantica TaxID=1317121 RepID=A0A0L1JNI1_9RHOB|nr:DUF4178 domain-containing protein [Pseudaestuariivita atlantica]KNG93325.1 hypothetical protein ATO11_12850 [Pseudaestuariivita atlantica]